MNKGIEVCTGDIIGILNSDDIYFSDALKFVNHYFSEHENLDFLFGTVEKHKLMHGYHPEKSNGLLVFIQLIVWVFL